jgi:hypothetical protein
MKAIIYLLLAGVCAQAAKVNFSEAHKAGRVGVEAKSLGGHLDKCLALKLFNNTSSVQEVVLEPGLLFDSNNNNQQDLINTNSEIFTLQPGKTLTKHINAYCIQAHNMSPQSEAKYTYRGFADSSLLKVANYINTNKVSGDLAQQALWVISDKNDLESVNGGNEEQKKKMLDFLSSTFKLKKKGNYELFYKHDPNMAFSGKVIRVKGKIDYDLAKAGYNSLVIQDASGTTYAIMYFKQFEKAGKHSKPFDFFTKGLASGVYYARVYSNQKLLKEEAIEI